MAKEKEIKKKVKKKKPEQKKKRKPNKKSSNSKTKAQKAEEKYKHSKLIDTQLSQLFALLHKSDKEITQDTKQDYERKFYYLVGIESGKVKDENIELTDELQGRIVMRVLYEDFIYETKRICTFEEFLNMIRTKRLKVYYAKSGEGLWVNFWDDPSEKTS